MAHAPETLTFVEPGAPKATPKGGDVSHLLQPATVTRGLDRALLRRAQRELSWFSKTMRRREPGASLDNRDFAPRLNEGFALAATHCRATSMAERVAIRNRLLVDFGDPDYFIGQAESVENELELRRQNAVRAATATVVVRSSYEQARRKLPWLKGNPLPEDVLGRGLDDAELVVRHTLGIIDAVRTEEADGTMTKAEGENRATRLSDWGGRANVLTQDRDEVINSKEIRTRILSESTGWGEDDMRQRERTAHELARQLPKALRGEFYNYAGLAPETFAQRLERWGFTAAANATTTLIPLETAAAGAAIAEVSPLHKLYTGLLWLASFATEATWLVSLNKAATESNNLLENHDRGAKLWAKGLYNMASNSNASRKVRRIAGWIGYVGGQITAEGFWVGAAWAAHKAGLPLNDTLSTFIGLNVGATFGEAINAHLANKANKMMSK